MRLGQPLVDGCDLGRAVDVVELDIAVAPARQDHLAVLLEDLERSCAEPLVVVPAAIGELTGREDLDPVRVAVRPDRPNPPEHCLELRRVAGEVPVLSAASPHPEDDEAQLPGGVKRCGELGAKGGVADQPLVQDGVTRYASKTASRFRSALSRPRSSFTSPTSAVYQLRAI